MKKLGVLLSLLAGQVEANNYYLELAAREKARPLNNSSVYGFRVKSMGRLKKPEAIKPENIYTPVHRKSSNDLETWTENVDKWVVHYVNAARKSRGESKLQINPVFEKAAEYRSNHMIKSGFTHYPKDGQTHSKVLTQFGMSPRSGSGENIYQSWSCVQNARSNRCDYAQSLDTLLNKSPSEMAKKIVKGYWNSKKGHRENMLDDSNVSMGSSTVVFKQDNKLIVYNTNLFEKR